MSTGKGTKTPVAPSNLESLDMSRVYYKSIKGFKGQSRWHKTDQKLIWSGIQVSDVCVFT